MQIITHRLNQSIHIDNWLTLNLLIFTSNSIGQGHQSKLFEYQNCVHGLIKTDIFLNHSLVLWLTGFHILLISFDCRQHSWSGDIKDDPVHWFPIDAPELWLCVQRYQTKSPPWLYHRYCRKLYSLIV